MFGSNLVTQRFSHRSRGAKQVLFLLLIACVGLCCFVGCGGNLNNNKFREGYGGIKGTLFLKAGVPAANARIQVVNLPSINTTTDAEGRFQLDDIPAGRRDLVITHSSPVASRISVWVVHRFNVTLDESLATLKPVGSFSGRISARPRLDAMGIRVVVKGMPYETVTHNKRGDFRFRNLPEGCHVLQVSSPYFVRKEIPNVCINAGKPTTLAKPVALAPSVPCQSTSSACDKGGLCIEGFCVPDPGGSVSLEQGGVFSLDDIPFEEKRSYKRILMRNHGPGQLRLLRFDLTESGGVFAVDMPTLPIVLQKGEALTATLIAYGAKLGDHNATLSLETDDPAQSTHQIKLALRVLPHPSNCLTARPGAIELGELTHDTPHDVQVTVHNRCGQTLLIQSRKENDPNKASCAPSWLGRFSMDVCLSSSQPLPVKVPAGDSVKLSFRLTPKGFGSLSGELYLPHDETPGGRLQIPIRGFVQAPGLSITPQPLDFGDVAPGEKRTLWLQISAAQPLSTTLLKQLSLQVDASGATFFRPASERIARLPKDPRVVYIPISLQVPVAGRLLVGELRITGLPGLGKTPFLLPMKARITAPDAPVVVNELSLGATDGCVPPAKTLYLNNTSKAPVTVNDLQLSGFVEGDLSLKASLPMEILPGKRVAVAMVQFTPVAKVIQVRSQLRVSIAYGDGLQTQRVVSLKAAAGHRVQTSFQQANSSNVDILLYVDQELGSDKESIFSRLEGGLSAMLKGLEQSKLNYRILPISGDASAGVSPLTPNPSTELKRLLQAATDAKQEGLAALERMLQRRNAPANTTTIVLFVSRRDDRSAYGVSRYLPQASQAPFAVFAALPMSQCAPSAHRYEQAVSRTGGAILDLCTAQPSTWKLWGERIQRLASGQRIQFPLRYQPKDANDTTMQLSTPQNKLPQEQWSYDPETNLVSLGHPAFLPPGQSMTVSYHTQCQ